jgi:integrase
MNRVTPLVGRTPATEPTPFPGAGSVAGARHPPNTPTPQRNTGAAAHGAYAEADDRIDRAGPHGWKAWERHVAPAGGCTQPVRLRGSASTVDARTGEVLDVYDAADAPDGVIYKACGTRRASVCPSCAETYRHDAYHLLRAGMAGSRSAGVPETVSEHPLIFLTLTAPSFGLLHGQRQRAGKQLPCRARRDTTLCEHGRPTWCRHRHRPGDPAIGKPLCPDCYDYPAHVIWNHHASELWRRTSMALRRRVQKAGRRHGVTLRVSFGKVAEYQARGVVHFHALIRLDAIDTDQDGTEQLVPPPACLDVEHLADDVRAAVQSAHLLTAPHPDSPAGAGWPILWGRQVDVRTVRSGQAPGRLPETGQIADLDVASYLAKYATKATEALGLLARRITIATIDRYADDTHAGRLIAAAWQLGRAEALQSPDEDGRRPYDRLRAWAHMLGFGGHFLTKSRRYSTTFTERRARRTTWRRRHHLARLREQHPDLIRDLVDEDDEETTLVIGQWTYTGSGWLTTGDQLLAAAAACRDRGRTDAESDITPDTTVRALAEVWFGELVIAVKLGERSPGTERLYRDRLDNQILPAMGGLRLREVTVSRVDRFIKQVRERRGIAIAKATRSVLSGMLALAVRHDAMPANPVRDIGTLPTMASTKRTLGVEEVWDLRARMRADQKAVDWDLVDFADMMLASGLRIGETSAITWSAADLDAGTVEVRATVVRVTGQGLMIKLKPKSRAGWRVIELPRWAVDMLRRRHAEQTENEWRAIFTSPSGRLRDPSNTQTDLRDVFARIGYGDVTSHTFRRTVATLMDKAGLSARAAADQLGHAKVSMVQDHYFGRKLAHTGAAEVLEALNQDWAPNGEKDA